MKLRVSVERVIVLAAAVVGMLCCLLATLVSFWTAAGSLPAFLYARHRLASTFIRWSDVPVEFTGLVWFAAIVVVNIVTPRQFKNSVSRCTFFSAIPMAGLGMWAMWRSDLACWPILGGMISAIIILVVTTSADVATLKDMLIQLGAGIAAVARNPLARALVLIGLAATVGTAESIRFKIRAVTANEAYERVFQNWYAKQVRLRIPGLSTPGGIKIVIFTDFQCPFCVDIVPRVETTIEEFRRVNKVLVDLEVKNFPLESECNPAFKKDLHQAACEAAAAERLVRESDGELGGRQFALWLYQSSKQLSAEFISKRLQQLGLAERYVREYPSLMKQIAEDAVYGQRVGIDGTPTILVNGINLPAPNLLDLALKYELNHLALLSLNGASSSSGGNR